jgi:uncharacterized phosphosugar-binding protein
MPTTHSYTTRLVEILQKMAQTQDTVLDQAATAAADALDRGNLIHLFGSGHSVIPTLDAFPRYGSFVGLHPLTDPRLMWHNVLGPGGVRELLWLERTENYIDKFLSHQPLTAGDVLVCFSHGGTNAAAIEAALYAKDRGITTIAVTTSDGDGRPAEHSSGQRLPDVCDLVIDTCCPLEDALVDIDDWQWPVGGSSTVVASAVSHELITRTAAIVASRGRTLPVFVSPTVPGATLASNDDVFEQHHRYVHEAQGRALQ